MEYIDVGSYMMCGVVWCGVVLLLYIPVLLITERRHLGGVNVCIRTAVLHLVLEYSEPCVLHYSWGGFC